jgi:hypothetical protein
MSQQQGFSEGGAPGVPGIESITGNDGLPIFGSGVPTNINLIGDTTKGAHVNRTAADTGTITIDDMTTTQKGVTTLATNSEAIAGTDTTKAITADDLKAKLGVQTSHGLAYGATTTGAVAWLAEAADGQIPIGSTGNAPVLGLITSTGGTIAWTFGAGTINAEVVQPTQEIALNYTNVTNAMSPYVVTATDYFISVDASGGPVTIQLPNTTTSKREFVIKDRLAQAAVNNITITTPGGVVTIDGNTSYTFTDNYESLEMLFNGTTYETF